MYLLSIIHTQGTFIYIYLSSTTVNYRPLILILQIKK